MMFLTAPKSAQAAIRRGAVRATRAPSVGNTQPWRLVLRSTTLEIHADWSRQLRVLDPRGRQVLISCGSALFNARVAMAAVGYEAAVDRFPDPSRPDLLARCTIGAASDGPLPLGALDVLIERRHTNRRRFCDEPVPAELVTALQRSVRQEGAQLFAVRSAEHRLAVARLSAQADRLAAIDPVRGALAVDRNDVHPLDSIDPAVAPSADNQCLLLLGTVGDGPAAWLRAGEALERLLLEITRRGYVASPLAEVIELAATELRQELQLSFNPQVLMRIGRAASTPASRRRRLVDVLEMAD